MTATTKKGNERTTRCSKCLMPSSLPGSNFSDSGECAWCQSGFPNYVPIGETKFQEILEQNRSTTESADCLVGISGGKDSSYALLEMKRKFGMRVEAFTYVHEGSAEFSLQNAKRVCRALNVQHHLVSLYNGVHLKSFKAFLDAWIEAEDPLTAAMTCVSCKHLHILGTRLAKDRRIPIVIWSSCPLETPPFIPAQPEAGRDNKSIGMFGLARLLAKQFYCFPGFRKAFLRHCSICTYGCLAFRPGCGFLRLRYPSVKHLHFFDYCKWDADRMVATLTNDVGWFIPASVEMDWHSDCLFHVFKEYMFQKMFGTSYTDAFLSNQIRHGLMTREAGYIELLKSKASFAKELMDVLPALGWEHLRSKLDPSCFEGPT